MGILDTLFGGKKPAQATPSPPPPPPDVLAAELLAGLERVYTSERGINAESLMCALGALAGFGCQAAVRAMVTAGQIPEAGAFVVAETAQGPFYFGDQLNQPLLEAPMSVWHQVAGAAQKAGAVELPDIGDIAAFVAGSVGGPDFGRLRVADEHQPQQTPIEALRAQWPAAYAHIRARHGDPAFTGWYFAGAAAQVLPQMKAVLEPGLAARIVMEAAVAMAKADPQRNGLDI